MHFLSNGDFGFPFTWPLFWTKQFYMWSYQNGAANPDGIIRMPGRLLDLLVFMAFGNLGFEYFYLATSLIITFAAFYVFAAHFLAIRSQLVRVVGALFFTCNPATLGNISKIGLVLAAAMLPLCLVAVRAAFEKRQTRFLLLWLIFLNLSLIHPFTFAVNLAVSGAYGIFRAARQGTFVRQNLLRLAAVAGLFVLANMYFILPLASMHSVSKDTLTNTVASAPTNYTALVGVLNTGDIFTGLSLSKNVVKDYEFYDGTYASIYFLGAFLFYAILLGLYLQAEKNLRVQARRTVLVLLLAFLLLVLLATVTFLHVDTLIRLLIQAPGGWAFRSPLKWQLYIPLALGSLFVLLASHASRQSMRLSACIGVVSALVLMNGFLAVDIYRKLLAPRAVTTFGALQQLPLGQRSILFVSGEQCWTFEQDNPRVMNELNQVLQSQNVQVKQISAASLDTVNLDSYGYVLDCNGTAGPALVRGYAFQRAGSFSHGALQLYANQHTHQYMYAASTVFSVPAGQDLGNASAFASQVLHEDFNTVPDTSLRQGTVALQDVFGYLKPSNLQQGAVTVALPQYTSAIQLYNPPASGHFYYRQLGDRILISPHSQAGYDPLPKAEPLRLPGATAPRAVTYIDPGYDYTNLIDNPSLESGLWQDSVGDCYDFDQEPLISMKLDTKHAAAGSRSLELDAGNHIACSGPKDTAVTPGQQYLLSFSYQSPTGRAGYSATFNDPAATEVSGTMVTKDNGWHTFSKVITAPLGAHSIHILLNAYPADTATGIARYDALSLEAVPNIQNQFYVVSGPAMQLQPPTDVHFAVQNPTKASANVSGARGPFFLVLADTYSNQWHLETSGAAQHWWPAGSVPAAATASHIAVNNSMNAWLVDPARLCGGAAAGCRHNADGSYDLTLTAEFVPQRWFYVGLAISGTTFLGIGVYLIRNIRYEPYREGYYRWHG